MKALQIASLGLSFDQPYDRGIVRNPLVFLASLGPWLKRYHPNNRNGLTAGQQAHHPRYLADNIR